MNVSVFALTFHLPGSECVEIVRQVCACVLDRHFILRGAQGENA